MDTYVEWVDIIRIFLLCCNRENGAIGVSPLEVLDWPYRFFLEISAVKGEYVHFVAEQSKTAKNKSKGKRKGRV